MYQRRIQGKGGEHRGVRSQSFPSVLFPCVSDADERGSHARTGSTVTMSWLLTKSSPKILSKVETVSDPAIVGFSPPMAAGVEKSKTLGEFGEYILQLPTSEVRDGTGVCIWTVNEGPPGIALLTEPASTCGLAIIDTPSC